MARCRTAKVSDPASLSLESSFFEPLGLARIVPTLRGARWLYVTRSATRESSTPARTLLYPRLSRFGALRRGSLLPASLGQASRCGAKAQESERSRLRDPFATGVFATGVIEID